MESDFYPSTDKVELPTETQVSQSQKVLVCLGRSCRKYNSAQVFTNFQANIPPDTELISVMCLGQCGNGPMVLIEPERIWYSQVHPDEVFRIIAQHLIGKSPVKAMLYPRFHQQS